MKRVIRQRRVLRGAMECEAFSIETFSGTAARSPRRLPAPEIARHVGWRHASLDNGGIFRASCAGGLRMPPVSENARLASHYCRGQHRPTDPYVVSRTTASDPIARSV